MNAGMLILALASILGVAYVLSCRAELDVHRAHMAAGVPAVPGYCRLCDKARP